MTSAYIVFSQKVWNCFNKNKGEKRKMYTAKDRTTTTIAIILILTITATIINVRGVNALDITTYAFIAIEPNPIGADQPVQVTVWLDVVPPQGAEEIGWSNFTVTITKPDGKTQIMGPYMSDPVGSKWFIYTPDTVGTYSFQFSFPGQSYSGDYYKPSSASRSLVVQEEPIPYWPGVPLPTGYWSRPIYGENREWSTITGDWLMGCYNASGPFNPYTTAPNTAHIVWTKEHALGGIVGGDYGTVNYYTGLTYEMRWCNTIIMDGKLYYNLPLANAATGGGCVCVDLRTGEQLWYQNITVTCGQDYDYESPNQHGVIPYLWELGDTYGSYGTFSGNTYKMYDAFTGNLILTLKNAQTGKMTFGPDGSILVYILNSANNWLAMWNSSKVAGMLLGTTGTNAWQWRPPQGATLDWRTGIQYNVTIPDVPGSQSIPTGNLGIGSGIVLAESKITTTWPPTVVDVAYDAETGTQLWVQNRTFQENPTTTGQISPVLDGVYCLYAMEKEQWYGFDTSTGNKIWGPTEARESPWGMYIIGTNGGFWAMGYGKFYSRALDGCVYCYDLKTGEHLWTYSTGNSGFETPYGTWPLDGPVTVADGKVYACVGEHSPNSPLWRGAKIHCINATTGEGVWKISGWMLNPAVSDGYLVTVNAYDNRIYCFGKGKTATTVEAPMTAITAGTSVVIRGTVTDQSPSAKGTPAIADEYMTPWMEYLYMQKPIPTNATGVDVSLDAIDPNSNYVHIGTATSDTSGTFSYTWATPDIPGNYAITATFAGSESYGGSYGETHAVVSEAPAATAPPEYPQPIDNTMTIVYATVAIILAIALVGIWIRRK
jgi:outer membrane protein assembly factor BamB